MVVGSSRVGSSLTHVLELKQRYENVRTDGVSVLLRDLANDGTVTSLDNHRWEAALRDGTFVKFEWYTPAGILDVAITDRQPWPTTQVAEARRRYQAILARISALLLGYRATTVGAAFFAPRELAQRVDSYIGQGSFLGHSPTDVENELDQLHGELMCFGQEIIELLKGPEGQAKTAVQKARDEELTAWKIVDSFQPQVNEVYRIEKLLNDAGVPKKTTEYWRNQSLPPYADIIAYPAGKAESLKQQFIAAKKALDAVMPAAQRWETVKRARELTNTRSELEAKALGQSPLVQWKRSTWDPFFGGWTKFRSEKKDIPLQTWPLSGTWDRIQEYRQQWIDLRKNAPFKSKCPEPLDPSSRKDPSFTDMFKDLGNIAKYGLIGLLAIGGIVAVSSVASNLKTGRDPAEKYMEMIRLSRKSRGSRGSSRSLPAREQLALPEGE